MPPGRGRRRGGTAATGRPVAADIVVAPMHTSPVVPSFASTVAKATSTTAGDGPWQRLQREQGGRSPSPAEPQGAPGIDDVGSSSGSLLGRVATRTVASGHSEGGEPPLRRRRATSRRQGRGAEHAEPHVCGAADAARATPSPCQWDRHLARYPTLRQPFQVLLDPYPNMRIRSACIVGETLVTCHRNGLRFFAPQPSHPPVSLEGDRASRPGGRPSSGVWHMYSQRTDFDLMDAYLCAAPPAAMVDHRAGDGGLRLEGNLLKTPGTAAAPQYGRYLAAAAGSDRTLHSVCVLALGTHFLLHHELHRKNRVAALGFFLIALEPLRADVLTPFVVSVDEVGEVAVFDVEKDRAHRLMRAPSDASDGSVGSSEELDAAATSTTASAAEERGPPSAGAGAYRPYRLQHGQATGVTLLGPCLELCNRCGSGTSASGQSEFDRTRAVMMLYVSSGTYDEDLSSELNVTALRFELHRAAVQGGGGDPRHQISSAAMTSAHSLATAAFFAVPFQGCDDVQDDSWGLPSHSTSGGAVREQGAPTALLLAEVPIVREAAPESVCTTSGVAMTSRPYLVGCPNTLLLARPRLRFWSLSGCTGTLLQLRRVYAEGQDSAGIGSRSHLEFFSQLVPIGSYALTADPMTTWFLSCGLTNWGSVLLLGRQPRTLGSSIGARSPVAHERPAAAPIERPAVTGDDEADVAIDGRNALERWLEELPQPAERDPVGVTATPVTGSRRVASSRLVAPDVARSATFIDPRKDYTVLMHLYSPSSYQRTTAPRHPSPRRGGGSTRSRSQCSSRRTTHTQSTGRHKQMRAAGRHGESNASHPEPPLAGEEDESRSQLGADNAPTMAVRFLLAVPTRGCVMMMMDDLHTILSAQLPLEWSCARRGSSPRTPRPSPLPPPPVPKPLQAMTTPLPATSKAEGLGYVTGWMTTALRLTGREVPAIASNCAHAAAPAEGRGWLGLVSEVGVARPLASMMVRLTGLGDPLPDPSDPVGSGGDCADTGRSTQSMQRPIPRSNDAANAAVPSSPSSTCTANVENTCLPAGPLIGHLGSIRAASPVVSLPHRSMSPQSSEVSSAAPPGSISMGTVSDSQDQRAAGVQTMRIHLESPERQRQRRQRRNWPLTDGETSTSPRSSSYSPAEHAISTAPPSLSVSERPEEYAARKVAELKQQYRSLGTGGHPADDSGSDGGEADLRALEQQRVAERLVDVEEPGARQGMESREAKHRSQLLVAFLDRREELVENERVTRRGVQAARAGSVPPGTDTGSAYDSRTTELCTPHYVEDDVFSLTSSARFMATFRTVMAQTPVSSSHGYPSRGFNFAGYFQTGMVPDVVRDLQDADRCKFELRDLMVRQEELLSQINEFEVVRLFQNEIREGWRRADPDCAQAVTATDSVRSGRLVSSVDLPAPTASESQRQGRWIPDLTFPFETDTGDIVDVSFVNRNPGVLVTVDAGPGSESGSAAATFQHELPVTRRTMLQRGGASNAGDAAAWRWATEQEVQRWKSGLRDASYGPILRHGNSARPLVPTAREHAETIPAPLKGWSLGGWMYAPHWPAGGQAVEASDGVATACQWRDKNGKDVNVRRRAIVRLRVSTVAEQRKAALQARQLRELEALRAELGL